MKYLLILLFLFSIQGISQEAKKKEGEADGKGIDCKLKSDKANVTHEEMFWFNNGKVVLVSLSVDFEYKNNFIERIPKGRVIGENERYSFKYDSTPDYLEWKTNHYIYKLNRKTLELKRMPTYEEKERPTFKAICDVFRGFQKVKKRQTEYIRELKKMEEKAREGNKI